MRFGLVANPFVCLGQRDHRESSRSRRIFPPASMLKVVRSLFFFCSFSLNLSEETKKCGFGGFFMPEQATMSLIWLILVF
jgi:hypothetical protein